MILLSMPRPAAPLPDQMLKFRWPLRCWDTLQGKNDSRHLLEEAAVAVNHLGLVPMPPGSALRVVFDEMMAHSRANDAMFPHASHPPIAAGPEASRMEVANGANHPPPLTVPPVAAGVLRDIQKGALNGEGVSVWGQAGAPLAAEQQRPFGSATGGVGDESGPLGQHPEDSNANSVGVGMVAAWGQWAPRAAAPPPTLSNKRKAASALSQMPFAEGTDPGVDW